MLKIKDNPTLDDFQVAVRVSGADIFSVSLGGNINYFKDPLNSTSVFPTEVYEGLAGAPTRLLIDSGRSTFYVVDSIGKVCNCCVIVVFFDSAANKLASFKNTGDTKMFFKGDYSHNLLFVLTTNGFVRKYDIPSKIQKYTTQ